MPRLPSVLGTGDLHLAELCAARIDGELVELADGWCPVDEPDLPSLRAAAAAIDAAPALIAERLTAAWVHGGLDAPPRPAQYCVPSSDRIAVRLDRRAMVREVSLRPGDLVDLGGARCTSVERTAFDLLREADLDDATVVEVVARLIAPRPGLADRVRARLDDATRLPHKSLARQRLQRAEAVAISHATIEADDAKRGQPSLTR
jgi:hypothetical protein